MPARSARGRGAMPGSVTRAQTPTPRATTAIPGQTQRQETPAWMTRAATAAPVERAGVEQRVQAHQRLGLLIRRCDASAFMAVSMEPPATSTRTSTTPKDHVSRVSASTHRSDRPGEQRDPQEPARPDPVAEVRHDRAGGARHRDGHGQQQAELRVVEREGVLDVEQHHGPAAPEEAEGGERRHHRAGAGEQAPAPRWSERGRAQDGPAAPALARKADRSTTTRVTRPAPTRPPPVALEPGGRHREDRGAGPRP